MSSKIENSVRISLRKFLFFLILVLLFQSVYTSCKQDFFNTDSTAKLSFSTDSIKFDTVFTTIGTATDGFKVYNKTKGTLNISEIRLSKGQNSNFRINVNGTPGNTHSDVELAEGDSIYVFVEATINPERDEMIESDAVEFMTNGNLQNVYLEAFGQDIHLIRDSVLQTARWSSDKPYVIYDTLIVDFEQTLTLSAGTHLHFHRGAQLLVLGSLISEGSADEPVIMEGDRLEDMYFDVPGQWEGVWLTKFSKNNFLSHTQILNANIGLWTDSVQNEYAKVVLQNCIIAHHSLYGVWGNMSNIEAFGTEISDCGISNVMLTRGGSYGFYHCTISNYFSHAVRRSSAVYLKNYLEYNGTAYITPFSRILFSNSIIWGNKETEIGIDLLADNEAPNTYIFENSIVKIDKKSEINTSDEQHYKSIFLNTDPKFKAYTLYDFSLDTLSQAKDAGNSTLSPDFRFLLEYDINGIFRFGDSAPDLGAYERLESE